MVLIAARNVSPRSSAFRAPIPRMPCSSPTVFGRTRAICDVTLDFPTNEVTAIIGPSGCGKSTLLRCLNRMHETLPLATVEGRVLFHGQDI